MSNNNPANNAAQGWQNPTDWGSAFNSQIFNIWSILSRIAGMTPVEVKGVNPIAQTVDVMPLVNMVDGAGNALSHGTIYGLPYFQLQSGNSAMVLVPTAGDIGVAIFADRDISSVVKNQQAIVAGTSPLTSPQANPGSNRMFDMSDGIYFGGWGNPFPTQYVRMDGSGVTVVSPVAVSVTAPNIELNGTDVVVHASSSYAQDVDGYGSRLTSDGGGNFTLDTYYTGAIVTTNAHPYNPPQIP